MTFQLTADLLQVVTDQANSYPPSAATPVITRAGPSLTEAMAGHEAVTTRARDGTPTTVYRTHRAFAKVTVPDGITVSTVSVTVQAATYTTGRTPALTMSVVPSADYGSTAPRVVIPIPGGGPADLTVTLPTALFAQFNTAGRGSPKDVWLQFATDLEVAGSAPATPDGANYELVQPIRAVRINILQQITVAISDTVGVADTLTPQTTNRVAVGDTVGVADTLVVTQPYNPTDRAGVGDSLSVIWTVKIGDTVGASAVAVDVTDDGHRVDEPEVLRMPSRVIPVYLAPWNGVVPVRRYHVWDGPKLLFEAQEPGDAPDTWIPPDISGWVAYLTLTPRNLRVAPIAGTCYLADVGRGRFGFDIQGGLLPTETPPLVAPPNSFPQPATYDGKMFVRTPSGETLTTSPFIVTVDPR